MVTREQFPGGLQALSNAISRLREELAGLREKGFRVPVLAADPPTGDPTTMWLFPDGRLRVRMPDGAVREVTLTATGSASSSVAKPADPLPVTYTTEWAATWTRTFDGTGADVSANYPTGVVAYGKTGSDANQRRAMLGFDAAAIRTALSGARVVAVDVWLQNLEAAYADGVYLAFGGHNNLAAPATYLNTSMLGTTVRKFGAQEGRWAGLDAAFGTALQADTIDGLVIDQQSDSPALGGRAAGVGGSFAPPRLRITYVK